MGEKNLEVKKKMEFIKSVARDSKDRCVPTPKTSFYRDKRDLLI